jgi:hypothetical protein
MSDTADLQHGCRAEYGPLELQIQTTPSSNGFIIYVEDHRVEHANVFEQPIQSTLDSAKENAVLRADEYLNGRNEASQHSVEWRCS